MVPRSITGTWLHDRVDEWHQQNPGQLAAQMLFEVVVARAVTALPNDAAGQAFISYPMLSISVSPEVWPARTYALKRQLPPHPKVVITTQPSHRRSCVGQGENAEGASSGEDPEGQNTEAPPPARETPSTVKKGKWVEFAPEYTHPLMSKVHGSAGDIGPKPSKDRADRRQYRPHRTRNSNTSGLMAAIEDNVSDHECQAWLRRPSDHRIWG